MKLSRAFVKVFCVIVSPYLFFATVFSRAYQTVSSVLPERKCQFHPLARLSSYSCHSYFSSMGLPFFAESVPQMKRRQRRRNFSRFWVLSIRQEEESIEDFCFFASKFWVFLGALGRPLFPVEKNFEAFDGCLYEGEKMSFFVSSYRDWLIRFERELRLGAGYKGMMKCSFFQASTCKNSSINIHYSGCSSFDSYIGLKKPWFFFRLQALCFGDFRSIVLFDVVVAVCKRKCPQTCQLQSHLSRVFFRVSIKSLCFIHGL